MVHRDSCWSSAASTASSSDDSTDQSSESTVRPNETVNDETEHPLLISIRRVLSQKPEYAAQLISAVQRLPDWGSLFGVNSGPEDAGVADGHAPQDGSSTTTSQQKSQSSTKSTSKSTSTKLSSVSSNQSRGKRPGPPDEEDDNPGDPKRRPVNEPSEETLKKALQWVCPYFKAFPDMILNDRFRACFTNFRDRSALKLAPSYIHSDV